MATPTIVSGSPAPLPTAKATGTIPTTAAIGAAAAITNNMTCHVVMFRGSTPLLAALPVGEGDSLPVRGESTASPVIATPPGTGFARDAANKSVYLVQQFSPCVLIPPTGEAADVR